MTAKLKKYLPIRNHRNAYLDKCKGDLADWAGKHDGWVHECETAIGEILSSTDPINPEFALVMQLGSLQYSWIGSAIQAIEYGNVEMARDSLSRVLGALAVQIPLDLYSYRDSLDLFGPENIGFGHDLNTCLSVVCTAVWLGSAALVQESQNWFQAYRAHDHLVKSPHNTSFLNFTLWMLSTHHAGQAHPLEGDPTSYGPYLALIKGFDATGLLREEIGEACDFHLHASDDFPGSEIYPSFYGPTRALFPAEIFAFAALRSRITGIETDVNSHPLLASAWRAIPQRSNVIAPPFTSEIMSRFRHAFE